jgi:riboflavin biosynthesis pyrimidine reductase
VADCGWTIKLSPPGGYPLGTLARVRRLLPPPAGEIDPFDAYGDRSGELVRIGMVMSADGSATDERRWTDGLGGAADLRVFRALRALADGILVGGNTVRTGLMGPHRLAAELRERRTAAGRPAPAPVVVVSRSLRLDWSHRLFTEADPASPTIVVTTEEAASAVPTGVPVLAAGTGEVDLAVAVRRLRDEYGMAQLLCEGGPRLAAQLVDRRIADELCLTLAPSLVGGRHHTPLLDHLDKRADLALYALYEEDGVLFLRYRLS